MGNYISKEKDKYLQAMKQTFKETLEKIYIYIFRTNEVSGACIFIKKGKLIKKCRIPYYARTMAQESFFSFCKYQ